MREITTIDKQEELLSNHEQMRMQLRNSSEVQKLANSIDVRDQIALLEFGKGATIQISGFADRILNTTKHSSMEETSVLIKSLKKIMDKFDAKDFAENKGIISRIFNRGKSYVQKTMDKYQTMGSEIDKIYGEIKKYEVEMKNSTRTLEQLYEENFNYFKELEKYIVAAKMKAEELNTKVIPNLAQRASGGDQMAEIELTTLRSAADLLERRAFDLEMAKHVAFQTAPQIRLMQQGNTKLIAKINSAFVVTIPVFKNGLIQAITAKRQKLVADSMAELDARTNEMLVRNAKNISQQSVDIARLAGSSSIKIETMEQTWNTIMKGLEETKAIEDENARNREASRTRLLQLQKQYEESKGK